MPLFPPDNSSREVVYTEKTSSTNITATTEGTATTIITASAFNADGSSAYVIEFFCEFLQLAAASNTTKLWLYQDGSSIGQIGTHRFGSVPDVDGWSVFVARRLIPSSGSRTYSIRGSVDSGTAIATAGAGGSGAFMPAFIRITRA